MIWYHDYDLVLTFWLIPITDGKPVILVNDVGKPKACLSRALSGPTCDPIRHHHMPIAVRAQLLQLNQCQGGCLSRQHEQFGKLVTSDYSMYGSCRCICWENIAVVISIHLQYVSTSKEDHPSLLNRCICITSTSTITGNVLCLPLRIL